MAVDFAVEQSTSMTLLDKAKGGDSAAWDLLVHLYTPLIFRRCRALNLTQEDASDVVQEVFLKLLNGLPKFEARVNGGFRNWLRTITRNEVTNWFRTRTREFDAVGGTDAMLRCLDFPEVVTDESLLSSAKPSETQDALHEALRRIRAEFSDQAWLAFWRTKVDGMPSARVAEELKITDGAVRTSGYRVLRRLKQLIGDQDSSEPESASRDE